MKRIIATVTLVPVLFCSCSNTWTQEDKDSFYQACMDDAATWSGSAESSRVYCDCVLNKIVEKYPHVSDALEHIEQLAKDPQMQECMPPDSKKTEHLPAQY
jgi:hypothetical protein